MIAEIRQTHSNGKIEFEILSNNELLLTARTPWMALDLPFNVENTRKLELQDNRGNAVFTTDYEVIDNAIEEMIPMKYLTTGSQRFSKYKILQNGVEQGSFYTLQSGFLDKKICIEYGNNLFLAYNVARGNIDVLMVFDGERQIAQITKLLATENNLDIYFLHLIDEYQGMFPLLSFLTIYFDYQNYRNAGIVSTKSTKLSISYTFDKNSNKYDKNWILNNFGQEAFIVLEENINRLRSKAKAEVIKRAKLVGIIFAIGWGIVLLIALAVLI